MAAQTALEIRPHVEIINGQLSTNSFKIAEHFGKQHKNVIQAIENLECSPEFRQLNFQPMQYAMPIFNGGHRNIRAYTITRDGFTFLAMGFTGTKAAQWKEAYINAFNRLEQSAQHRHQPAPDLTATRIIMRFDGQGGYTTKPIPNDAYVLTLEQIVRAVACPNDLPFTTAQLAAVIEGASRRLQSVLSVAKRA